LTEDDPLKKWRERLASNEPAYQMVIDLPMKISLGPDGLVQFDSPFAMFGIDIVGTQRTILMASLSMLRDALEYLENNPGEKVELNLKPSAH
jgi:hypothetical protein